MEAYADKYDKANIYECPVCIVESEIHMVQALRTSRPQGCNALVVYLGNFGPEISARPFAKHFDGPVMFIAAAEETESNLTQAEEIPGDVKRKLQFKLRNVKAYIPEYPVGTAAECADMIENFSQSPEPW